jgi:hypothetical protein
MMTAISNSHLRALTIPVGLMPRTLGNSSLVPTKLQWNLYTKHIECKDKCIAVLTANAMN